MRLINADALDYSKLNISYAIPKTNVADWIESAPTVTNLTPSDISDLRNELCLKCGKYKEAHNGACNGCRWRYKT